MNDTAVAPVSITEALNQVSARLPEDKKLSWLQLCEGKSVILSKLETEELRLQGLVLGFSEKNIVELQTAIDEYKKGLKDLPEIRKGFTRYLDKIYDQMMLPEKRAEKNENYIGAQNRLLELKLAREKEAKAGEAKAAEKERFITHIKNQNVARVAAYTMALQKAITDTYTVALENGDQHTVEEYIQSGIAFMSNEIPIPTPEKFNFTLHTREELMSISETIDKPNFAGLLNGAISALKEKFSMYAQDRENKQKAIQFELEQRRLADEKIKEVAATATSVNNLMTGSGTTVTESDGVKSLKRKKSIKIIDNDFGWCKKIVAAFLTNWDTCCSELRIKKASNLSVGQMAAALDDANIKVDGVEYIETVK